MAQCTFSSLSCLINWDPDRQWTHLHFYTCQTLKLLNNGVKSEFMNTEMNLQTLIFWNKVLLFMIVVEFDLNSIISTSWTVLSKWMTFATIKLNGMTNNIEGCLEILFVFDVGFLNVHILGIIRHVSKLVLLAYSIECLNCKAKCYIQKKNSWLTLLG